MEKKLTEIDDRSDWIINLPKDFLTKFIFYRYSPPDLKTALITIYAVRYAAISSFLISSIVFFFYYKIFFIINPIISIVISVSSIICSYFKFRFDKRLNLSLFLTKYFARDFFAFLFGTGIMYMLFYIIIFHQMKFTLKNAYITYVVFHSVFFTGLITMCLSHLSMHFLRLYEGLRNDN